MVTPAELQERIDRLPRVPLAYRATPLEPCHRLPAALGVEARLSIKRDDLTGVAFGGNKLRNLEFRLAEAVAAEADTLILGVDLISNSARQTAGVAARLGLRLILVLIGRPPEGPPTGNLLIDQLLGAEIHVVPDREAQEARMAALAERARAAGACPFVMTASPLFAQASAVAYAECTLEIVGQLAAEGRTLDWLYMCSSGKGIAGPLLAARALGLPTRVVSVSPSHTGGRTPETAARIANEAAALLHLPVRIEPGDLIHHDAYGDPGYGVPTAAAVEAMCLLGRTEGILVDPVYTGKALAGLVGDLRAGRIGAGETVVFVHTGGLPLIFDRAAEIADLLAAAGSA